MSCIGLRILVCPILTQDIFLSHVSVLIAIYCKKLFCWGLRHTLVYGYSNKSLRAILILHPISKIIVVDFLWRLRTYLATRSWPRIVPSYWTGHRSNQNVIGYLHSVCSIIISGGIPSQVSNFWSLQSLQLYETNNYFYSLLVCIASNTVKAILVGVELQGNSPLDFSMYITQICCAFKNKDLAIKLWQ